MPTLSKIMHVDDDENVLAISKIALEVVGGFEVFQCESGFKAVKEFKAVNPDLVLLDVMMPGKDGPETLRDIRNLPGGRDVPIVFLTAKSHLDALRHYSSLDVDGVLVKPFDPIGLSRDLVKIYADFHKT